MPEIYRQLRQPIQKTRLPWLPERCRHRQPEKALKIKALAREVADIADNPYKSKKYNNRQTRTHVARLYTYTRTRIGNRGNVGNHGNKQKKELNMGRLINNYTEETELETGCPLRLKYLQTRAEYKACNSRCAWFDAAKMQCAVLTIAQAQNPTATECDANAGDDGKDD